MAKTAQEIIAENQAEYEASRKAEEAKAGERHGALSTGVAKFLSTVSGGGTDYLDMLAQRMKGKDIDVDKIREGYVRDAEANPMSNMVGGIAGTAAQALPIGRAMQGLGLLGKAAPGIIGGIRTGAAVGAGVGTVNEAAKQLDRFGSEKSAAEDYSGWGSVGRIGKEAIAGAAGGALGGVAGNLFTKGKGMIANMKEPASERLIQAALREADDAAKLGVTGPGKLGPEEALRAVRDPALRHEGADLAAAFEGRMAEAGKGFSGGELPKEASRNQFRQALQDRVAQHADDTGVQAKFASADAAKAQADLAASREALRHKPLDIASGSYWAVQGDPQLKAITKQLLEADRGRFTGKLTGNPRLEYNKTDAAKLATARYPSNTVGGVERAMAHDPSVAASADKILRMQNPAFQAADDAVAAMTKAEAAARAGQTHLQGLGDFIPHTGRQIAQNPPPIAPSLPSFSPTRWGLELAKAGHDVVAGKAIKKSTDRMMDDPLEEILRQVGRRTRKQRITEPAAYSVLSGILGNAMQ